MTELDTVTKSEKNKKEYIDKIIFLLSPILTGLNHWQISALMDEVIKKILDTTIYCGVHQTCNPSPSAQKVDQKKGLAN